MFVPSDGLVVEINPTVDTTGAHTSGDLLFVPTRLDNVAMNTKGHSHIRDTVILDADNQKAAMDLLFFDRDPGSIGTRNNAVDISETQLGYLIGILSVAANDYTTLKAATNAIGAVRTDVMVQTRASAKEIWVAAVVRGTPTYTGASKLKLKFFIERQQ